MSNIKPGKDFAPYCHFRPMTYHQCDSRWDDYYDGWECDFCGHVIPAPEWNAKLKAKHDGGDLTNDKN